MGNTKTLRRKGRGFPRMGIVEDSQVKRSQGHQKGDQRDYENGARRGSRMVRDEIEDEAP